MAAGAYEAAWLLAAKIASGTKGALFSPPAKITSAALRFKSGRVESAGLLHYSHAVSIAQTSFAAPVGADVSSFCSKCGEVLHVVLTHKDELVDKCECKECQRRHKYKPVDEEVKAALKEFKAARRAAASGAKKKATKKRVSRVKEAPVPEVVFDESIPFRDYDPKSTFCVEDQIRHPKFGEGIVVGVEPPHKMEVNFADVGPKFLMHARA